MSELREHDPRGLDCVEAAVVSNAEAPYIRTSRQEPDLALGSSTLGSFFQELKSPGKPSLDVARQFPGVPFHATVNSISKSASPSPRRSSSCQISDRARQAPDSAFAGVRGKTPRVGGTEEIVQELLIADPAKPTAFQPVRIPRVGGEGRVFAWVESRSSRDSHVGHRYVLTSQGYEGHRSGAGAKLALGDGRIVANACFRQIQYRCDAPGYTGVITAKTETPRQGSVSIHTASKGTRLPGDCPFKRPRYGSRPSACPRAGREDFTSAGGHFVTVRRTRRPSQKSLA